MEKRLKPRELERGRRLAAAWRPGGPVRVASDNTRLFAGAPPTGSADRSATELAVPETGSTDRIATEPAEQPEP